MNAPVEVVTFGCRLNAAESERVRALAAARSDDRPTIVLNTCAVTTAAERDARRMARKLKRERPDADIVVTGCAAQRDPASVDMAACIWISVGPDNEAAEAVLRHKIAYYGHALSDTILANLGVPRAAFVPIEHAMQHDHDEARACALQEEVRDRVLALFSRGSWPAESYFFFPVLLFFRSSFLLV